MHKRLVLLTVAVALSVGVGTAFAQEWKPPDPKAEPWRDARLRLGPVFFNPTFQIRDLGVDDNVFNDMPGSERRDLTGTLSMSSLIGLQARALLINVEQANSYIWYRTYTSERSVDGVLRATAELRLGAIRPWVGWQRAETHERGGFEIDARAGRELPAWEVGSDVKFGWRLAATGAYRKHEVRYAEGEQFDGVDLKQALDQTTEDLRGYGRLILTDTTDAVAGVQHSRRRFTYSPLRDSDDVFYFAGIESSTEARLALNFKVGWMEQRHKDPTVPGFRGVSGSGSVGFVVGDVMRLDLAGNRTMAMSYEEIYPYYVEEGGSVRSVIRFSPHFDLRFDARAAWLKYDKTVTADARPRTDRTVVLGGEFGYYFGGADGTRVGIRYEYAERDSANPVKNYARSRVLSDFRLNF